MSSSNLPSNPPQTTEEEKVAEWFQSFGEKLVHEVRCWLRKVTKARTAVSTSDVAMSVWASFIENHSEAIDVSDKNGAWVVLAKAAKRHCEAWNRYATRHPQQSLDAPTSGESSGHEMTGGRQIEDCRELDPVAAAMIAELSLLLPSTDEAHAKAGAQAIALCDGGMNLVQRLTTRERQILCLKLAGSSAAEIAELLGIEKHEVDDHWKSVRRNASAAGRETTG